MALGCFPENTSKASSLDKSEKNNIFFLLLSNNFFFLTQKAVLSSEALNCPNAVTIDNNDTDKSLCWVL
jgi:hypothetical protein